jgi:hypothetical protein
VSESVVQEYLEHHRESSNQDSENFLLDYSIPKLVLNKGAAQTPSLTRPAVHILFRIAIGPISIRLTQMSGDNIVHSLVGLLVLQGLVC